MNFDPMRGGSDQRLQLDAPPPSPELRVAPSNPLSTLAPVTGPNGEDDGGQDAGMGDMGSDPMIQALRFLAGAEDNLKGLSVVAPGVMPVIQDFLNVLRAVVPQALAEMQAGVPMAAGPTGAGMMGMLAGMQGGGMQGGGMPPGAAPAMPPGGAPPMPAGMPPGQPMRR